MQVAETGDDLIGKSFVVVTVPQDQGFADALLEAAFVIDGVANVKEAMVGRQIYKDAHAPRRMSAQRHNDHRTVPIKVGAFLERFVWLRIKAQGGLAERWKFLSMR